MKIKTKYNLAKIVCACKSGCDREENLLKILECMQPMIKRYACRSHWGEKEDVEQELILAVIEAVNKMENCDNDGKGITFFGNAIKNRYLEIYRKGKRASVEGAVEWEQLDREVGQDTKCYQNVEFLLDLEQLLQTDSYVKEKIAYYILHEQWDDQEIARRMNITRQYVNRCKKEIFRKLSEYSSGSVRN